MPRYFIHPLMTELTGHEIIALSLIREFFRRLRIDRFYQRFAHNRSEEVDLKLTGKSAISTRKRAC